MKESDLLMKKAICTCLIVLVVSTLAVCAFAQGATASFTGPDTVRAGDTITLTFKLNGTDLYGVTGKLSFDETILELKSTEQKIGSGWLVEFNGNSFVAYDNNLSSPINKSTSIFTVKFKVKSGLETGTKLNVSLTDLTASDGTKDDVIGTVTYSAALAAPKSTDATLKSLTVSNATISPAFDSATTQYTAQVPFAVEKLSVQATANDSKAKVKVDNLALTPGGSTRVSITVTAESGAQKVYVIVVTRAQDPNYTPSSDCDLAELTAEDFRLSPVFRADVTEYVIWLPYETDHVAVAAVAADSAASVTVSGGESLTAGADNPIRVVCTAEDGTQKTYLVIAKRAAAHGEEPTEPTPTEPMPTEPEPTEPSEPTEPTQPSEPTQTTPSETQPQGGTQTPTRQEPGIPVLLVIVIGLVCMAGGVAIGFAIGKK